MTLITFIPPAVLPAQLGHCEPADPEIGQLPEQLRRKPMLPVPQLALLGRHLLAHEAA